MSKPPLQLPGSKTKPQATAAQVQGKLQAQFDKAMQGAKDNLTQLAGCEGPHDLQKHPNGQRGVYQCLKCGGVVTGLNAWFYTHGFTHAKK